MDSNGFKSCADFSWPTPIANPSIPPVSKVVEKEVPQWKPKKDFDGLRPDVLIKVRNGNGADFVVEFHIKGNFYRAGTIRGFELKDVHLEENTLLYEDIFKTIFETHQECKGIESIENLIEATLKAIAPELRTADDPWHRRWGLMRAADCYTFSTRVTLYNERLDVLFNKKLADF